MPPEPSVFARLVECLRATGYTPEALRQALDVTFPDDVGLLNRAPALERVRHDPTPAATLMRVFFLEADEPARRFAACVPRRTCDALVAAGVLQRRRAVVRARVRIDPVGDQYFIADRRFRACDVRALGLRGRDPIYPPSSDSLMLRDALVAPAGGRMLDLCTGSGVQAIVRSAHAEWVTAVDVNPRAVAVTRCNAQLNGVGNVDVRLGDLYAPVRSERFDLIVANPPFVVSPYARAASYHSGGPRGDRVLRRIIAGWPAHLRSGGRAFAISHVGLRTSDQLASVASAWFRRFPGRAVVLRLEEGGPVDLAAAQALFALEQGMPAYAREVSRWVAFLSRHRIGRVALVLVAAQHGAPREVEIIEAQQRVLSLPVSAPPVERIRKWLLE